MTATVTTDFREEYEAERLRWLRKRFLWYTGLFGGLSLLTTLWVMGVVFVIPREAVGLWAAIVVINIVGTALYLGLFLRVRQAHRPYARHTLVRFVFWLIVINGILQLPAAPLGTRMGEIMKAEGAAKTVQIDMGEDDEASSEAPEDVAGEALDEPDETGASESDAGADVPKRRANASDDIPTIRLGAQWLASVFVSHLLASLFIPWTPREAIRPLIPLLSLFAVITLLFGEGQFIWRLVWVVGSPIIGLPGILWCSWRASRFRDRFHSKVLRRSYREMKRELVDARRIHEDLFPAPITSGGVHFIYKYEPMRQIGGDFLYAHRFPGVDGSDREPLSVVMIDVTGHGIPAALTVNRLYGELERLFAEEPDIRPGDVLSALNSYVHYTLATHSVYATALCLRIDPDLDILEWASGGHPPAFLRSIDGRIDRLDSTAFVLGACHGEDFKDGQQSAPFKRGDTLIAYTDGAIEARNAQGRMMGLEGFQRLVATLRPDPGEENGWASAVLRAVEHHRFGPPADDTLIVELFRPLRD